MTPTLVSPEAAAYVGRAETGEIELVRAEAQRWAAAVGDYNPLYFDADFARSFGHPDVIVPGAFLSPNVGRVPDQSAMRPDGIVGSSFDAMPLPPRRMAGGEDWHFFADLYPGDRLTWRRELAGLDEKHGSSGGFVVITWVTEYHRGDELVARNVHRLLALGAEEQ